jgi:hypothetical protein
LKQEYVALNVARKYGRSGQMRVTKRKTNKNPPKPRKPREEKKKHWCEGCGEALLEAGVTCGLCGKKMSKFVEEYKKAKTK